MQQLMSEGAAELLFEPYGDQKEFAVGQVLFVMRSSSGMLFVNSAVNDDGMGFRWNVAAPPHSTDRPVVNVYGASVSVCRTTPERQLAAWLFVKWFTEPVQQARWVRASNYFPAQAMMFGEYFPNPALFGTTEEAWRVISERGAFLVETIGTAMLGFLVCAVTSDRNTARPPVWAQAVVIGVGVAAIMSVLAPLTQAALNPARDFGPRLVSYFLGWDQIAIPGPRGGWLTVYIIAPTLGAIIGGGIYKALATLMPKAGGNSPDKAAE